MEHFQVLALIAGAFNMYAFWRYNRGVFTGSTVSNFATWFLWSIVTGVQASSYDAMGADWAELVVMVTDSSLCVLTFGFLFWKRKFTRPSLLSLVTIGIAGGAIIVWQTTSAINGNIMAQVPYAMAFLPTIWDARDGTTKEDPIVWLTFTLSFTITVAVLYLKATDNIWDYLFPAVAITMHAILAHYAFRGRRLYTKKWHQLAQSRQWT